MDRGLLECSSFDKVCWYAPGTIDLLKVMCIHVLLPSLPGACAALDQFIVVAFLLQTSGIRSLFRDDFYRVVNSLLV